MICVTFKEQREYAKVPRSKVLQCSFAVTELIIIIPVLAGPQSSDGAKAQASPCLAAFCRSKKYAKVGGLYPSRLCGQTSLLGPPPFFR